MARCTVNDLSHHGGHISAMSLSLPTPYTAGITPPVLDVSLPDYHETPTVQLDSNKDSENWLERPPHAFVELHHESDADIERAGLLQEEEMKQPKTKATIGILSTLIAYVSVNSWMKTHYPEKFIWSPMDREEVEWVATSRSWLDRKACRWIGICGGSHMHFTRHRIHANLQQTIQTADAAGEEHDWQTAWLDSHDRPEDLTDNEEILREIPQYVLDYAPLVHLFSGEQYWPCDIAEHLHHVTPELNYTAIQSEHDHPTLNNLDQFNQYQRARWVYLTSNDDVEDHPTWLGGEKNIPNVPDSLKDDFTDNDGWVHRPGRTYLQGLKDAVGDVQEWFSAGHEFKDDADLTESITAAEAHARYLREHPRDFHTELKRAAQSEPNLHRVRGGRSDAPAVLVAINKGHGIVDAFWFFFYSFNLGNTVFNVRFGNHVGDWEHTAIRFYNGEPKAIFFSEHNFGSAYSYQAVEKIGKRPVIYSAVGSHAMYATSGAHPYVLPWGILHDQTDRGPLWDPALNSHAYTYDFNRNILRSSNFTPSAPTEWFHFAGHWGDKFYPLGDKRQYRFAGQYHYVNGPLGPKFKNLGRRKICGGPDSQPCVIKHWLGGESKVGRMQNNLGEQEGL